jgi:hypothetical protein
MSKRNTDFRCGRFLASFFLSLVMIAGISTPAAAAASTETISASLVSGQRNIIAVEGFLYVLNQTNIQVVNTATKAVRQITIPAPPIPAPPVNLIEGVYLSSDKSLWLTSYTDSGTAGEVLRINTLNDHLADSAEWLTRFSAGGTNQRTIVGASGIATDGAKIFVSLNGNDSEDAIAVFDRATASRDSDLPYTLISNQTNNPGRLAILGGYLYVFQGLWNFVVRCTLTDCTAGLNNQKVIATGFSTSGGSSFAVTNPAASSIYFGRTDEVRKLTLSGTDETITAVRNDFTNIRGVGFTPSGFADGNWVFIAHGSGVAVLQASNYSTAVGSLTGTSSGVAVGNGGDYLYVAAPPDVTRVSLNPTVTYSAENLTLNTNGALAAPEATGFWKTVAYTSTALPAGLSLNSSTGVISGTPTSAGATSVTVTATNSTMFTRTSTFTITVIDPDAPPPSPPASGGVAVSKPAVPELAATGSSANGLGQLGLVAITAGALLALVARRLALRDSAKTGA